MRTIVYLHGFMGSAKSQKAQLARQWFSTHLPDQSLWVPDLPYSPLKAIDLVLNKIRGSDTLFIGSSLGGFYANYLSERFETRSVLINPSVYPFELLQDYLGVQTNPYTGEQFELTSEHMKELKGFYVEKMENPGLRRVLLQTGDETLDFRQAEQYYGESSLVIEQGGDHSFVDFEQHLPAVARFLLD